MPHSSPQVSVIVVVHNSLPLIIDCLKSLAEADSFENCQLIVVDNNSSDQSASEVRRMSPDTTILSNKKNRGFAAACNQGAEYATGEYLLFLNPDLEIDRNAITELLNTAATEEKPGAVTGRLRFPDGRFQANCRDFPTPANLFLSRGAALSRFFSSKGYSMNDATDIVRVPAVAGTMLLIKRELFNKLGRFDRRFFMYVEDTDLCYRLEQAGYVNYYNPKAGAIHNWEQGSSAGRIRRAWYHHWSIWKYFLKHQANGFSLILLPLLLLINLLLVIILPGARQGRR